MNNKLEQKVLLAYTLYSQCLNLKKSAEEYVDKINRRNTIYPTVARTYNRILQKTKTILKTEPVILQTIEHVQPHEEKDFGGRGNFKKIAILLTDLATLQGTLASFVQIHTSDGNKDRIGFELGQD